MSLLFSTTPNPSSQEEGTTGSGVSAMVFATRPLWMGHSDL